MKLDLTNLNWNSASVLNFNYLYYLALMLNERTNDIMIDTTTAGISDIAIFDINDYQPGGFFRFHQLYSIYVWTLFLGQHYFFNSNNLSNDSFKNGHRIKHFGYTLDQLSQIASFDFSKNPLIPNQRINYYDRFLKPLYLLLKEFKKIWINGFIGKDKGNLIFGYNNSNDEYVEVNHLQQTVQGQDKLDFYTLTHAQTKQCELFTSRLDSESQAKEHKHTFLGGRMNCGYQMFYSFGYDTSRYYDGSWHYDGPTYEYASNFEGPKFNYYFSIPSAQIQCPIPLISGMNYELYMYSFTYPTRSLNNYIANDWFYHRDQSYDQGKRSAMSNTYNDLRYRNEPTFQKQPFGNYFKVSEGTLQSTFNTFDISLPSILPYDQTIFNDLPLKLKGKQNSYQQVDYVPYSYDTNLWYITGPTPSRDYHDTHDLTPGSYLRWKGPTNQLNDDNKECIVEWWYKPLLVVSYESIFKYN